MYTKQAHQFLKLNDDTARLINDRANHLYRELAVLDISETGMDEFGRHYFTKHHRGNRLFFSIESSADIIYRSVMISNKKIAELSFIDYGAGLGTLFLLAGSVGFKQVYYNDYFPQWAGYARTICEKLNIPVTDYITGDIDTVIDYGINNHIRFDIIASRNVVEHIYDLKHFYTRIYQSNLTDLCYATTTANYHNIAMRLKHYVFHYQVEKNQFKKQREEYLKELRPSITTTDLKKLVALTRGRAFTDFTNSVDAYFENKRILPVDFLYSNTCDCRTGQWAEHLITKADYIQITAGAGFKVAFTAGFWDTHYKYKVVNLVAGILNRIIKLTGKKGYWFAPFVNIVASKNNEQSH